VGGERLGIWKDGERDDREPQAEEDSRVATRVARHAVWMWDRLRRLP